jgi:pimeloyl-ACP methyl ester carboxylesterase
MSHKPPGRMEICPGTRVFAIDSANWRDIKVPRLLFTTLAGLVAVFGPLDLRALDEYGDVETAISTREGRGNLIRSMFVPQTPQALQQYILSMMLGTPDATALGAGMAIFDPAIRTESVIDAPILLVAAGTAKVPDTNAMRNLFPHLEVTQVPETGHFLMMEKPDEFNRLLADFLERIDF